MNRKLVHKILIKSKINIKNYLILIFSCLFTDYIISTKKGKINNRSSFLCMSTQQPVKSVTRLLTKS